MQEKLQSKADKMFVELGYVKNKSGMDSFFKADSYTKGEHQVVFYKENKKYECYHYCDLPVPERYNDLEATNYNVIVDMDLHKAINEKIKELGWLDE